MFILRTGAICTECKPERCAAIVALLKAGGWPVEYGGVGGGSILPRTPEFLAAFYDAIDRVDFR
jgi:hypothetical protein